MEKKKLDWIISLIREEMMTANPAGGQGGFGPDSPAAGPRAGKATLINFIRRKGPQIKLPPGSRKRWKKPE
jgi:GTPase involved in cell partitioning and DNA repair